MPNVLERYENQFGERPPEMYFSEQERLIEAVQSALDRGEAYTHKEWLEEAGYTEGQIEKIQSGDMQI